MHPYSVNVNDRTKIFWVIVPLSLLCGYMANEYILKNLALYQTYSWIIDMPSSGLAFLFIFYQLFDNYAWKWSLLRFLFKTPDLNGDYQGELLSSRDNKTTPIEIKLQVIQTLSKIRICLITNQSTSKSEMATLLIDEPDGPLLIYEFINDHRKIADPGLSIHRGITRLTFNKNETSLKGIYYTSPERGNHGEISTIKNG